MKAKKPKRPARVTFNKEAVAALLQQVEDARQEMYESNYEIEYHSANIMYASDKAEAALAELTKLIG